MKVKAEIVSQPLALEDVVDEAAIDLRTRARVEALVAALWPGPLTLVLPRGRAIPDLVTSGLATVAVRAPAHPVAEALIARAGPLAAPSANRFGRISPTRAADVLAELGDRIALILDGGPCAVGVESTVLALAGGPLILRPGGVPREAIEALIGPVDVGGPVGTERAPRASPGTLASHYAPRKPLSLLDPGWRARGSLALRAVGPIGILVQSGDEAALAGELSRQLGREVVCRALSDKGDPNEAARALFAALRSLDESPATALFAELPAREDGLRFAIADRLRRAAAR